MRYVLSLDGGGIKGIIMIRFLERLQQYLERPLYEVFDMYVGSNIGGLIALTLGNNIDIDTKIIYDNKQIKKIIDKSFWDVILPFQFKPKFDGIHFKQVMNKHFGDSTLNNAKKYTLVTSYNLEKSEPIIYKSRKHNILTSEVARITCAVPTYFPCVETSKCTWEIDGSISADNPALIAYVEAKKTWIDCKYNDDKDDFKILSIGTGFKHIHIYGDEAKEWGQPKWLFNNLSNIQRNAPYQMINMQCKQLLGDNYLRINCNLENASNEIDDISKKNIKKLKALGDKLFGMNLGNINKFFGL